MKYWLSLFFIGSFFIAQAQQPDALSYKIRIKVLNFMQKQMEGHTTIQMSLPQTDSLHLDLANFTVDSVLWNGQVQNFRRDPQQIVLLFSTPQNAGTHDIDVFYHGQPLQDPGGFGACLWQDSTFAFNLGVSLNIEPHNMGKAWFPCRDNFTDKALFETWVTVPKGMKAICGGTLQEVTLDKDSISTHYWKLRDPIPTYLASYAISRYDAVIDTFNAGPFGKLPVSIYVPPADTGKVWGSFANLEGTVSHFEDLFGPYLWERVGYVAVPFNGGAMEHATNVAYPKSFFDGFQVNEIYMAHELAHSWFGNLVTCDKAEEMWLNEGWASYTETIFKEHFYGKQAAKDYLRKQHYDVLTKAKLYDGGHFPVSNVPQSATYGLTVYSKGATIAHSLRGTLGDSLFFNGIQHYLDQLKFKNANSDSLQRKLEEYTQLNLTDFFQGWVHTPGHSHFAIDSFIVTSGGPLNQIHIAFRQRLRNRTQMIQSQKVKISLIDQNKNREDKIVTLTGETCQVTVSSALTPVLVWLDPEEEMADASTDLYFNASAPVTVSNGQTMGQFFVTQVKDTALLRYECNWVAPGGTTEELGVFVGTRYWEISGIAPDSLVMKAKFEYNGSTIGNGAYEDTWILFPEDSLLLLYRENPTKPWRIATKNVTANLGTKTDERGNFVIDSLAFGQYAIGYYDRSHIARDEQFQQKLKIYPNPADQKIEIQWEGLAESIELMDLQGKLLQKIPVFGSNEAWINTQQLVPGNYIVRLMNKQKVLSHSKIIIQH